MKSAIAIFIGFVLGCGGTTVYWYYSLFVPWTEQNIRSKEAEAKLLNMYVKQLEAGEVEKVIYFLKMDAKSNIEDAKQLNDHRGNEKASP